MKVEDVPGEWVKLARAVFARNTEVPPDKLPLAGWFIAREEMAMRAALAAVAPLIAAAERERCAVVADKGEADYRPASNNPGSAGDYWKGKADAYKDAATAIRALD